MDCGGIHLTRTTNAELWEAIRLSDQLVDEFLAADIYVFGVPMDNFSVPGVFKAYIDQIVRVGRTVVYGTEDSANGSKPLVLDKKMFIIEDRGASDFQPGGHYETRSPDPCQKQSYPLTLRQLQHSEPFVFEQVESGIDCLERAP